MKIFLTIAILFVFQNPEVSCYTAGVFEHYVTVADTPENTIKTNLESYRDYATLARQQSAEILVFPEYGLTGTVSDPIQYAIDLNDTNQIITELRNMALEYQVYLVINILEKVQQANSATKYYNTNLVFDKTGNIILKYRKINLFDEPNLTPGDADQTLTFTTSFGVTFGIFTCYDILFNNPSRRVLENPAVTDIVYPTAWVSTMPFFTALSVQHGYSLANGVNLLAANYGKPKEAHGGSGIYLADGTIAEVYISDSSSSKRIIQNVTKITTRIDRTVCPRINPYGLPGDLDRNNVTYYQTVKKFKSSDATFKSIDLNQESQQLEVCNNELCCSFNLKLNTTRSSTSIKYKVVAFDGSTEIDDSDYHMRVCSLLACSDDSNDSCGTKLDKTGVSFTKITVEANVKNENGTIYFPVSSDAYLLPAQRAVYCNNPNATDYTYVEFTTTKKVDDILVFGIVGKTASAGSSLQAFGVFILTIFAIIKVAVF